MTHHCPNQATCVDLEPRPDGTWALGDTKAPAIGTLKFTTAELDAFATAWLAGKWGNNPAAVVEAVRAQIAETDSRWEREDESYEVLAEDTVYDDATSLGEAVHKAGRAIDDIEAGELADCAIYIRRTTREIRPARP